MVHFVGLNPLRLTSRACFWIHSKEQQQNCDEPSPSTFSTSSVIGVFLTGNSRFTLLGHETDVLNCNVCDTLVLPTSSSSSTEMSVWETFADCTWMIASFWKSRSFKMLQKLTYSFNLGLLWTAQPWGKNGDRESATLRTFKCRKLG